MPRYIPLFLILTLTCFTLGQPRLSWGGEPPCPEPDLFQRVEQFHGDGCVGQLIGVRLALGAKSALQKSGVTGRLKARYYARNCAVDGIQVAAGTTIGNRSLVVLDKNDNRLELSDASGKHAVEARLTTLATAKSKRSLELKRQLQFLPADSGQRLALQGELDAIAAWFRTADAAQVVTVRPRQRGDDPFALPKDLRGDSL
jgi:formylmethanofuran dehydrogenase subunit E